MLCPSWKPRRNGVAVLVKSINFGEPFAESVSPHQSAYLSKGKGMGGLDEGQRCPEEGLIIQDLVDRLRAEWGLRTSHPTQRESISRRTTSLAWRIVSYRFSLIMIALMVHVLSQILTTK